MNILSDHNIANSLRINSKCRYFIEINEISEFKKLYDFINEQKKPIFILGEGTNIVPNDYYDGIVIKPRFNHIKYDKSKCIVSVGSSVNWHNFVEEMVENNIYGFENLSLIPGSVGASPIQNIGAYGQDVSELISKIDCFDYKKNKLISLSNSDCNFSYRNSSLRDKPYIIYNIDFHINRPKLLNLKYDSLQNYIKKNNINASKLSLSDTSKIIINIRNSILPDPNSIPNAGSFFKNPVIGYSKFQKLKEKFTEIPFFKTDTNYFKVPAAWLIDKCGFKKINDKNVGVYKNQPLVVINLGNASGNEIINFAKRIKDSVFNKFDIELEEEVIVM